MCERVSDTNQSHQNSEGASPLINQRWWKQEGEMRWIGSLLFLVTVIILFFIAFIPSFSLIVDDGQSYTEPALKDHFRQLMQGELPLWSHHSRCGYPLLAKDHGGLYFPHTIAFIFSSVLGVENDTYYISYFIHILAAISAAYSYLRFSNVTRMPSTIGALSFGLCGPVFGLCNNWPTYFVPFVFVPIMLIYIDRIAENKQKWIDSIILGFCGGQIILSGHAHAGFKALLLISLYALSRFNRTNIFKMAQYGSAAALIALLVGGAQLFATVEFVWQTTRVGSQGTDLRDAFFMSCPRDIINGLIFPFLIFPWNHSLHSTIGGSAVFAGPLAAVGIFSAVTHLQVEGRHRNFLFLLLLYYFLMIGHESRFSEWLQGLPILKQFRWPVRWSIEFAMVAGLLSGFGLELLRKASTKDARLPWVLFLLWMVVITLTNFSPAVQSAIGTYFGWAGISIVLFWFFTRDSKRFWKIAVAWTLIASFYSSVLSQRMHWADERDLRQKRDVLCADTKSIDRVLYLGNRSFLRSTPAGGPYAYAYAHQFSCRTVLGYGFELRSQSWRDWWGIGMMSELEDENLAIQYLLQGNLLKTLRVGYVIVPANSNSLINACASNPNMKHVSTQEGLAIYKHEGFHAPAFFVKRLIRTSWSNARQEMRTSDLSEECFVASDYVGQNEFSGVGIVNEYSERHGKISMNTSNQNDGFLVLTCTNYPGWVAYIDNNKVEVNTVNAFLQGIEVPKGDHSIRFEYQPKILKFLAALSILSTIVLGAIIIFKARMK